MVFQLLWPVGEWWNISYRLKQYLSKNLLFICTGIRQDEPHQHQAAISIYISVGHLQTQSLLAGADESVAAVGHCAASNVKFFKSYPDSTVVGNRLGERWRARGVVRTCGGQAATCLQDSTAQERNVQLLKPSCNVESSNQHDLTICRASSSTVLTTAKNHPVKTLSHQRNQSAWAGSLIIISLIIVAPGRPRSTRSREQSRLRQAAAASRTKRALD